MLAARLAHPSATPTSLPEGAQVHAASHSVFCARQGQLVWNAPSSMLYVPSCPGLQLWPSQPPFLLVCSFHLSSACSSGSSYSVNCLYCLDNNSQHHVHFHRCMKQKCSFCQTGSDSGHLFALLGYKGTIKKATLHERRTTRSPCCTANQ